MASGFGVMAAEHQGPVRVWGDLSSAYRLRDSGGSDARNTNLRHTGTVSTSSYLWRPWFASFSGSLSLSADEAEATGQQTAQSEFAHGDAQLSVFPTSRFPFQAWYEEDRNTFDNATFDEVIATTEYGFSQRYRSTDGTDNYLARYENNAQDRGEQSRFESQRLSLSASNRFTDQALDSSVKSDTVANTVTGESAASHAVTIDHSYGSGSAFTLDNLLSGSRLESDLFASNSEAETAQVASFLTWQPGGRRDLRFTASARISEFATVERGTAVRPDGVFATETASANLNQGLIYEYSRNLQFTESINLASVDTDGEAVTTMSESLGTRYSADRVSTTLGDYGWSVASTYTHLGGDAETEESLNSRFSHSLLGSRDLDNGYQRRTNLTQSLGYEVRPGRRDEKRIDHSWSAAWSRATINRQNLFRFLLSDGRRLDSDGDYFQLANLQYSGSSRLTRYSQFSGNATLQYTNQNFDGNRSEQATGNGQLEYRHGRLFRVPLLVFTSRLQAGQRHSEIDRLTLDPAEGSLLSWENSLRYRVGRLETQFDYDVVQQGDEYDQIVVFQLKRSFGDL